MWNLRQMRKDYEYLITECDIEERDAIGDIENLDDILLGKSKIIDIIYRRIEDSCIRCATKNKKVDKIRERYGLNDCSE